MAVPVKTFRRVFIPINGIRTIPRDKRSWPERFADWIFNRTSDFADPFEYFSLASTKSLFQAARVRDLVALANSHLEKRLVLVGHSNGCDIICQALPLIGRPVESVHLFAGAVEHDFDCNNLNAALVGGQVARVYVYASSRDNVLRYLARPSRLALGLFGIKKIGYGFLGYQAAVAPKSLNIDPVIGPRVSLVNRSAEGFAHSTWFEGEEFERTLQFILSAEEAIS